MSKSLFWKIRAGFSVALLIVLAILGSFVVSHVDLLWSRRLLIVEGIALAGAALVLAARFTGSRADQEAAPDEELAGDERADHPLAFFRSLAYWGCLLAASAYPVLYLAEHLFNQRQPEPPPVSARNNIPQVLVETPKPKPVAGTPRAFPALRVDGYICNGSRSTVVLNGKTATLGESLEGVRVVAIETWGIAVEMEGDRKWLATGP